MSRLTGADALGLFEAYQAVYAPQELTEEQVWEEVETWVNSLLEEGYDLSDYTWEEMYENYLNEASSEANPPSAAEARKDEADPRRNSAPKFADLRGSNTPGSNTPAAATPEPQRGSTNAQGKFYTGKQYGYQSWQTASAKRLLPSEALGSEPPKARSATAAATPNTAGAPPKPPTGSPGAPAKPSPTPTPSPSPAPRPTATAAAPKPAAAPAAKPAGSAMDQWAKANTKLAAAAAEKARIRGTSQSDNPLMKGMPGKRPMTPSVQSPTLAKDLGKGSGNQSLLDNPNASKAAPPKAAPTTAPKPTATPARNGFGVSAAPIAAKASVATATATPTPAAAKPATPKPSLQDTIKKNRGITSSFDLFDLVKGHLLDEGYADTEEAALAIMINMSEEWRQSIIQ